MPAEASPFRPAFRNNIAVDLSWTIDLLTQVLVPCLRAMFGGRFESVVTLYTSRRFLFTRYLFLLIVSSGRRFQVGGRLSFCVGLNPARGTHTRPDFVPTNAQSCPFL
ncbi:hypothetical protein BaRGS_00021052 [Batillaria attramentaria]|uniref:Uncharacterized protein n=1 Tax=Batillaria attramentaria TaxID=370345 RepID=A0ABD0KKS0_9CAEN